MTPPEKLRHELERLRDQGELFWDAWPEAKTAALEAEPLRSRVFWNTVFMEQAGVWQASYSGPNVKRRMFVKDDEHVDHLERSKTRLVA
jgi:hypothetical protein